MRAWIWVVLMLVLRVLSRCARAPFAVFDIKQAALEKSLSRGHARFARCSKMDRPMSLLQPLPEGPLDIVGDIHGESEALENLLTHLGYDANGHHADARTLVFAGDLVDRGPDSPGVLRLVMGMVGAGHALAVPGNHEN